MSQPFTEPRTTQGQASRRIAITGWQCISAMGVGADSLRQDAASLTPVPFPDNDYPPDLGYRVASFELAALIGEKGLRNFDRITGLALGTAQLLRGELGPYAGDQAERTGFVIGTSTGSTRSSSDFTRDSFVQDRPFRVNPARFPNTVMNCAAGQCAIRFKARGVNATIAGGRLSGLLALQYASQILRRGYADCLLTGAVEEMSPQMAWAHRILSNNGKRYDVPLGEGCGMFVLEPAAARGFEIAALRYGNYCDPATGDKRQGVKDCINDALREAGIQPADLTDICLCGTTEPATAAVEQYASAALREAGATVHDTILVEQFGDTYSATFALALCHLLAQLQARAPTTASPAGMVLATNEEGHTGCLVVRRVGSLAGASQ